MKSRRPINVASHVLTHEDKSGCDIGAFERQKN